MNEMLLFWNTATVDRERPSQSNQFAFLKSTMYRSCVSTVQSNNRTNDRNQIKRANEQNRKIWRRNDSRTGSPNAAPRGRAVTSRLLAADFRKRSKWNLEVQAMYPNTNYGQSSNYCKMLRVLATSATIGAMFWSMWRNFEARPHAYRYFLHLPHRKRIHRHVCLETCN